MPACKIPSTGGNENLRTILGKDIMGTIHHPGKDIVIRKTLRPHETVAKQIQGAVARCCRRLLVLGPARSRRLASVRQALAALGFEPAIIDMGSVQTRRDLDAACKRAALGADFFDAMVRL